MRSEAARKLSALLLPRPPKLGMTQADLARKLGVTAQAVSSWMYGRKRPSPRLMAQIEKLADIPMREWLDPAKAPLKPKGAP